MSTSNEMWGGFFVHTMKHCYATALLLLLLFHILKKIAMKRELWSRFSGLLDYIPSPTEGLRAPGPTTEPTQSIA